MGKVGRPKKQKADELYNGRPEKKLAAGIRDEQLLELSIERRSGTRREAHVLSEQKRRQTINDGFDLLKSVLPHCDTTHDSKAAILRKGNI